MKKQMYFWIIATFDNYQIYRPQIHENNGATKLMYPQVARLKFYICIITNNRYKFKNNKKTRTKIR